MNNYKILVNILDVICKEAPTNFKKYHVFDNEEELNLARSRALIHLYFKVSFGILDFTEREYLVTDGPNDGGLDGYYIDSENKTISLIQSKFRANKNNFESKEIKFGEILAMDVNRILDGENCDVNNNKYNGKIQQFIREIKQIEYIARYHYKIIIIANLESIPNSKLNILTGGFPCEIFNFQKCYKNLVYPIVSGTYFNATDLCINIDLSNKVSGTKISYSVTTEYKQCEITVLFVPTLEIAKIMLKYKNSILKFNPRSYLEFVGQKVNGAIRDTILSKTTNEFALFNNGITMLSDETFINEKVGIKNKAQLTVKNPQIINGGQTAFNLSKIYEEFYDSAEEIFKDKEVLLKIITFIENDDNKLGTSRIIDKNKLIEAVSEATNQQTAVTGADRVSNDSIHIEIQKLLFDKFGIFYERKRGEFSDGLSNGYISIINVLERNLFYKIFYTSIGDISKAAEKKLFQKVKSLKLQLDNELILKRFYFAFLCFNKLTQYKKWYNLKDRIVYGKIYAFCEKYFVDDVLMYETIINNNFSFLDHEWHEFELHIGQTSKSHLIEYIDKETGEIRFSFDFNSWRQSDIFVNDVKLYFQKKVL